MVVADGVGGNMCGEVASRSAVQTLQQEFERAKNLDPAAFFSSVAQKANQNIRDYVAHHPECKGMATTLTAAIIRFPEIHLLQVGDSRAYLLRGGSLYRMTEDHTLVGKMVKEGILSEEEAETHPKRHVIINALGVTPKQKFDYSRETLKPGDQILLCSDGLYGEISEETMQKLLLENPPKEAIQRLVAAANDAGGKDNISITLAVLGARDTAKTWLIPGTQEFKSPAPSGTRKHRFPLWLVMILALLLIAGGGWYLGSSTGLGKKARGYILSLLGQNPPTVPASNQGEKP